MTNGGSRAVCVHWIAGTAGLNPRGEHGNSCVVFVVC